MSWEEASAYLAGLGVDAMRSRSPSLHRIEALCEALDHPERAAPALHVTGTNGKSSTAVIVTHILAAADLSVGTFTSPHLESVRERLALNGAPISQEDFGDVFEHIAPYLEMVGDRLGERLSYFEVLTGMFFLWAAEAPVDAIVVEVGLGGRFDATNVVPAGVAVITHVGLDHTDLLGDDRATIAREKAGIVKPGAAAVTAERAPDVLSVLEDIARDQGAELSVAGRDFELVDDRVALGGRWLSVRTSNAAYEDLWLPLHGPHQSMHAATALEAAGRFLPAHALEHELVAKGLSEVRVPGRLEPVAPVDQGDPLVVLDVAHNPDGISALVGSLVGAFAFERATVVLGALSDKDYAGMLAELVRIPCTVVATAAATARAVAPEELRASAARLGLPCEVVAGIADAVSFAVRTTAAHDIVVVTGSHYVVGPARTHLLSRGGPGAGS